MKRFLTHAILTFVALVGVLFLQIGCTQQGGGGSTDTGSPRAPASGGPSSGRLRVGMVTDKGGLGDQSFNDSAYAGLKKAEADMGIDPKVVQSKEEADYLKNLTTLAEAKYDLVVGVGVLMTDSMKEVAAKYPNVKFALVDGNVDLPNVACLNFKEEEGSYLVGVLTGLMTKSNKVAFMGGMEIPLIVKFESGFKAGVETVNPKADAQRGYTNKWDDPGKGKEMAESQYNQGIDIIYAVAGACNKGVIEAAKGKGPGFWAVGVDSDQDFLGTADPSHPAAPGRVLTTMIKHVDTAVYQAVKNLKDGQFKAGKTVFGLKEGGVSLSDMLYTKADIPADVMAKVNSLKQMIVDGKIQVPTTLDELKAFKPPALDGAASAPPASASPAAAGAASPAAAASTAASAAPAASSASPAAK